MANGERRSGNGGRRKSDFVGRNSYGSLPVEPSAQIEELSYDGVPLLVPASFGSDGNEHWLSTLALTPEGEVAAFSH